MDRQDRSAVAPIRADHRHHVLAIGFGAVQQARQKCQGILGAQFRRNENLHIFFDEFVECRLKHSTVAA